MWRGGDKSEEIFSSSPPHPLLSPHLLPLSDEYLAA